MGKAPTTTSMVALAGIACLSSCQGARRAELALPSNSPGTAIQHAVRNDELRGVMERLGRVTSERLPQELNGPGAQLDSLAQVMSVADELADAADSIASVADRTGLTPSQRVVFLELAGDLRRNAAQISAEARQGQTRLFPLTMEEIDKTCSSCHALFRNPSVDPQRADVPQGAP